MTDQPVILTPDEAVSLLVDGAEYVHNYANPAGGMMIGIDYSREDAEKAFRSAFQIEIAGGMAKSMRHPIAVWDSKTHVTFFEADVAKVDAFEAAKAGA